MALSEDEITRLLALRGRRPALDLNEAEVLELYALEKQAAPNPYGEVVAVLSSFPPYLAPQPDLIAPFIAALYEVACRAFRGFQTQADLWELLTSKGHVDDDLGAALAHHRAEFERVVQAVAP